MAKRRRVRRKYYDHGGQHMNIPRHPGMANIPPPPPQGVIKPTDTSLKGRANNLVGQIKNFSMAPGGQAHGGPTQLLAEATGVPSALRIPQSYTNFKNDPSIKTGVDAAANTLGALPLVGGVAGKAVKASVPYLSKGAGYIDDAVNAVKSIKGVKNISNMFKTKKLATAAFGNRMGGMRQYEDGGMQEEQLPGGTMTPIEGSDAVEFEGASHEQGGITLDPQTEVEGGETMDQVTMRDGGKKDYFFSSHLKHGGMPFSARHKQILEMGGSQEEIDMLAKIQEQKAGRNPGDVADTSAATGGIRRQYDDGGFMFNGRRFPSREAWEAWKNSSDAAGSDYPTIRGKEMTDRQKKFHDQSIARGMIFDPKTESYKRPENDESVNPPKDDKSSADKKTPNENSLENLTVASDEYLSDYGDIPGRQGSKKIGDNQYYLDDDKLQKYITEHENFGAEWMDNVDPEVLKAAGITDYSQLVGGDKDTVTAYQKAWNAANPDNLIQVDGKFGEQTIRTGVPKLSNNTDKTPEDTPGDTPTDTTPTDGGGGGDGDGDGGGDDDKDKDNYGDVPDWKRRRGVDGLTAFAMGSQFLPAMSAMMDDPDYMNVHQVGSVSPAMAPELGRVYLDRINMNTERERNAADLRSMNKFIENSGMGPAGIANRMAAYAKKQQGDREISAQEAKINVGIQNQEHLANQDAKKTNIANMMNNTQFNAKQQMMRNMFNEKQAAYTDEFNRGADAATKDRRLMGLQSAVHTFAGINKDRLQYEAQERMAQAISGDSGVLTREEIARDLSKAYPNLSIDSEEFSTKVENTYLKTLKNNSNG